MKKSILVSVLALVISATSQLWALDGAFKASETWSVTLEYSDYGTGFTGTKNFTGTQTGTIIITADQYTLLDKSGVHWSAPGEDLTSRSIYYSGNSYSVSGSYVFAPAFGSSARGIVFLGGFVVSVPLLDGEIPAFYRFDTYSGYGYGLDSIQGGGDMVAGDLIATVSSTLSLQKIVGPPIIIQQPTNDTVFAGQDAVFSVIAGGDGPFTYSWRKGSTALPAQTNFSLRLANVRSSDAGGYSVLVSNSGGKITSATAQLVVKQPSFAAWSETWESASPGSVFPSTNSVSGILADEGHWVIVDTVSQATDCGPVESHADITTENGRKLLKLISMPNDFGCAENIGVDIDQRTGSGFPIPLLHSSQISFFEQGYMSAPYWNGYFGCIVRPCGDTVALSVTDDLNNQVVYIFQRATNYIEHALTNGPAAYGYREVFLDPAGGAFARNLHDDLASVAGPAGPGENIVEIEFSISAAGWAELDDLIISHTSGIADTINPSVAVTAPLDKARLLNPNVRLAGTAKDNLGISKVEFQLNGDAFQNATGTTNWFADIVLAPSTNIITIRAQDTTGNLSATVTRLLIYVQTSPLTVTIAGNGTVLPDYTGQLLEIGKTYTITATPGVGSVFSNWTGSVLATTQKLAFLMQSNLSLQANFIPNPFIPTKGSYQGLFYPATDVTAQNAGSFLGTVTDKGTFTAKIQLAGKTYSLSGTLSIDGAVTKSILRAGLSPLTVSLQLDLLGNNVLLGQITEGNWIADLVANRSVFNALTNPAPQAGQFTLVFPGADDSSVAPGGYGIVALKVDTGGKGQLAGQLPDGTKISQTAIVSRQGQWPFYLPQQSGQGMLLGWLNFNDPEDTEVTGVVKWVKAARATAKYYPAGFVHDTDVVGAKYVPPISGGRVINVNTGQVWFAQGNLQQSFTNDVMIATNNKVINLSSNKLSLIITPATGLFKGSVTIPGTTVTRQVIGVFLQNVNAGFGSFLGTNQSGGVWVGTGPEN